MNTSEPIGSMVFALLLCAIVFFLAFRAGFFRLPPFLRSPVKLRHVAGVILLYIGALVIVAPLFYLFFSYFLTGTWIAGLKTLTGQKWQGWLQVGTQLLIFFLLILYCFLLPKSLMQNIFWGHAQRSFYTIIKNLGWGFIGCCVSYPFVLLINLVSSELSFLLWGKKGVSQVAVEALKHAMDNPFLFFIMILTIIFAAPFIEEVIFRGFLQNWLKNYLGRLGGICLSSLIFALMHFSISQGIGNFELIASLFGLSLFIGFIYERQQSLWASIGLHASFNAISILGIAFFHTAQ